MIPVYLALRSFATDLILPPGTDVLRAREPEAISNVHATILKALASPIGALPLAELCQRLLARTLPRRSPAHAASVAGVTHKTQVLGPAPSVVIVVSDHTRPTPYRGEGGILWPLVDFLLSAGIPPESITLLVATGTHRVPSDEEIWALFDQRVRQVGVRVQVHDAYDWDALASVGQTASGSDVFVNRHYVEADLRILTGLVEPHLVAGVSGGRKSICPGLLSVKSVQDFHGARTLAHERATSLVLDGNPCHEISLEISRMARADFILNVTMRQDGRVAGVFAGDMEQAHMVAVDHMREFAQIPIEREYDVVITHGGLVGVNHYQAQKAADMAAKATRQGGYVILIADTTDLDPLGTDSYRSLLGVLADIGPEAFARAILSKDWEFAHDQWGVQIWTKLFQKLPCENLFYFSPQTAMEDYAILPCVDPKSLLEDAGGPGAGERTSRFVSAALTRACAESEATTGRPVTVAYLADGPHGVPVLSDSIVQ
jgi:hypothetical protein